MMLWSMDQEVGGRLAGAGNFRANPGVPRVQLTVLEPRVVFADCFIEQRFARCIESVVDFVHPGHIGTEANLSGHVYGDVHAKMSITGNRIDQSLEWRFAGQ